MKEKLLKIKTLAERGGTEGERESAKHLLGKLCKKHGIKPEDVKELTDITVSYCDGVKVVFQNGVKVYDHQFPNGAVVRYFADGRRQVLREVVQQVQIISVFGGGGGWTSTTTTGGF